MKILIPIPCLILYNTYMLQTGIGIAGGTAILEFYRIVFLNRKSLRLFCGSPVRPITILSQNFTANNCKKTAKKKNKTNSGIERNRRNRKNPTQIKARVRFERNRAESSGIAESRRPKLFTHAATASQPQANPLRGDPPKGESPKPKGGTP